MKKKWLALLLGLVFVMLCAVSASAETVGGVAWFSNVGGAFGSKDITWSLDLSTGEMTISGSGSMGSYYQMGVLYRPWDNTIAGGAGNYLKDIKSLVVKEGVTDIADSAFSDCPNLLKVSLPSTVTKIGASAFRGASSLTSISIPDSVLTIGDNAFRECTALLSVKLPSALTQIGSFAFYGCGVLPQISIPSTVIDIGEAAFMDCPNLVGSVDSYGNLGKSVFRNTGLTKITVHNCNSIDQATFAQCKNLQSVVLDCAITVIPNGAFGEDTSLLSVTIPDTVTNISYQAFTKCRSLTSLTLPKGLLSLGDEVFTSSGLKKIVIPDTVVVFGKSMFDGCSSLMTATLPSGLTLIPEYTFQDCTSLQIVNIPKGVSLIGKGAFWRCNALLKVDLPDGLLSIDSGAFARCSSLTSVTLPDTLLSIGESAFYYTGLMSITIPESVASLSTYCFCGCDSLASVSLPDSITNIPESAFQSCPALSKIKLPNKLVSIGNSAFYESGLVSVNIPSTLMSVGSCAFWKCPLKTVNYAGTASQWNDISIAEGNDPLIKAYSNPEKIDISDATVDAIKDQVYTGKKLKPKVTVKYDGAKLVKGQDYTVSWSNNKKIGTATVTVTGKGSYTGKLKATFKIVPKAVTLSSLKAGKNKLTVKWQKSSGIDGYEIQYSLKKNFKSAKTVKVTKAGTTSKEIKNLKKGKTYYVRIRAYKAVDRVTYYSAWSAAKKAKVK